MKQPDGLDIGNKWDLVFHRLQIETAKNLLDYAKRYIMKQKEAEKL